MKILNKLFALLCMTFFLILPSCRDTEPQNTKTEGIKYDVYTFDITIETSTGLIRNGVEWDSITACSVSIDKTSDVVVSFKQDATPQIESITYKPKDFRYANEEEQKNAKDCPREMLIEHEMLLSDMQTDSYTFPSGIIFKKIDDNKYKFSNLPVNGLYYLLILNITMDTSEKNGVTLEKPERLTFPLIIHGYPITQEFE